MPNMNDPLVGRFLMSNAGNFQLRVGDWMHECFSPEVCRDMVERNHRFLEESLELVQSLGCTASEAHQLVDYVFSRPVGTPYQEVGEVMVTLAALCLASDPNLNMDWCAETELKRIHENIDAVRAKQASKPKHSPLPQGPAPDPNPILPLLQTCLIMADRGPTNLNLMRDLLREAVAMLAGSSNGQDSGL